VLFVGVVWGAYIEHLLFNCTWIWQETLFRNKRLFFLWHPKYGSKEIIV
jgi:hypothetical protein